MMNDSVGEMRATFYPLKTQAQAILAGFVGWGR